MLIQEKQNKLLQLLEAQLLKKEHKFKFNNFLLVGKNRIGKSFIFRKFYLDYIEKNIYNLNTKLPIYFIDTVNRNLSLESISDEISKKNIRTIVYKRFQDDIFNLKDSIESIGDGSSVLAELIKWFKSPENYKENLDILNTCLGENLNLKEITDKFSTRIEIKVNNIIEENLSNGLQSMLRIIVEVLYAVNNKIDIIFIDEIALHLNPESARHFVKMLQKCFPDITWIWTTHSQDVLLASQGFNVLELKEDKISIYNGNDFMIPADLYGTFDFLRSTPMDTDDSLYNKFLEAYASGTLTEDLILKVKSSKFFTSAKLNIIESILKNYRGI